jgi:micrococcal nuclease
VAGRDYTYRARCNRVVDGDTYDVEIDVGFYVFTVQRLRLRGWDTAELRSHDEDERKQAQEAKQFAIDALMNLDTALHGADWPLIVATHKADSFGRFLADVQYPVTVEGETVMKDLGEALSEAGLAEPYRR